MSEDGRPPADGVEGLFERWVATMLQGETPDAEELCRDRPELLAPLRERIRKFERIGSLIDPEPGLELGRRLLHHRIVEKLGAGGMGEVCAAEDSKLGRRVALKVTGAGDSCLECGEATETFCPEILSFCPEIPGLRVVSLLGRGGMGCVFLAEDEKLGRQVAVKLISPWLAQRPNASRRFLREARAMAAVEHPHLLAIHAFGEADSVPYLVTPYIDGESLAARLRREGALPLAEALRIADEAAEGLAAAWAHGIVHRDLKPGNLLLDREGWVRVADFGLAHSVVGEEEGPAITSDGQILGTPQYLSPEQARGESGVDCRTDLYSLGIVLFEMLTGERPFSGTAPLAIIDQQLHAPLPSLQEMRPGIPDGVAALVEALTRKDPHERIGNYVEVREWLARLRGEAREPPTPVAMSSLPSYLAEHLPEPEPPLFVAREAELEILGEFLARSLDGDGRVAFVTGDAGAGKTSLVTAFLRRVEAEHSEILVAAGSCSAHTGTGDAYGPIRQILSLFSGNLEARVLAGRMSRGMGRRLWSAVPMVAEAVAEGSPDLVETLLRGANLIPRAERAADTCGSWLGALRALVARKESLPADVSLQPGAIHRQTARLFTALARQHPLLLVLEDLHWADTGTLDLLAFLAEELGESRILVVGTYRPEDVAVGRGGERHPLESVLHAVQRRCGACTVDLEVSGGQELVEALVDSEPNQLGRGFRDALLRHTGGHALFTVELLRTLRDRGMIVQDDGGCWVRGPELDWQALPARVEAVVGERLDRLSDELRQVLTVASVEGEEFTAEVVARVRGEETRETIRLLSTELEKRHRLVAARGICRLATGRISLYGFSHVLFQRYLSSSLDEIERAQLNEDVGTILETLYGDARGDISPRLARHFEQAGLVDKAITYLRQAGENAMRVTAHGGAIEYFRRALDLVENLSESSERDAIELGIQLSLAVACVSCLGWTDPSYGAAAERARTLSSGLGDSKRQLAALFHLSAHKSCLGELRSAWEILEEMLPISEARGSAGHVAATYLMKAWIGLLEGRLREALADCDRSLEAFRFQERHSFAAATGLDIPSRVLGFKAELLAILGHSEKAQKAIDEAIGLAREIEHPHGLVHVLDNALRMEFALGRVDRVVLHAEEARSLAEEYGFGFWVGSLPFWQAWSRVVREGETAAMDEMRKSIEFVAGSSMRVGVGDPVTALGEGLLVLGRAEEALGVLLWGLEATLATGEGLYQAEIHRAMGEALLALGRSEGEVVASFEKALELARAQGARLFELKTATALARCWRDQGRRTQARHLLAGTYDCLTEGFDSPVPRKARALLDELAGAEAG